MTAAVTPGLGWPAVDRYPGGPDVPSAPSALGWPAPRPPTSQPPAPRTPAEADPVPASDASATEEAPEGAAEPVAEPGAPDTDPTLTGASSAPPPAAPPPAATHSAADRPADISVDGAAPDPVADLPADRATDPAPDPADLPADDAGAADPVAEPTPDTAPAPAADPPAGTRGPASTEPAPAPASASTHSAAPVATSGDGPASTPAPNDSALPAALADAPLLTDAAAGSAATAEPDPALPDATPPSLPEPAALPTAASTSAPATTTAPEAGTPIDAAVDPGLATPPAKAPADSGAKPTATSEPAPTADPEVGVEAEPPAVEDPQAADEDLGEASTAYRQSLVRDAMARVVSPKPPPDVSRETWRETAAAGHTVPDVSRETEDGPESELAAFVGEDTPIAAAAAAAIKTTRGEPFPKPARPRILTVANQKGGVGKTTTTVNIAAGLALRGLDVLVIDLDPQGNASTALGISHSEGTASVYDVLVADRPMDTVVQETALPGLFCVPATVDLAGAEIELVPVVAREGRLKRALAAYGRTFDYVFIDCPPSLGLLTVNALVAANEIVIPIQCEFYALEGLGQLLRNVELIRSHLNADLWVSTILLTMYDSRTKLADQVATEVRGHFGELVLESAIPRSVRISEAPGYGQTVLTYDPASRGAQAYLAAAREMAERGARMTEGS